MISNALAFSNRRPLWVASRESHRTSVILKTRATRTEFPRFFVAVRPPVPCVTLRVVAALERRDSRWWAIVGLPRTTIGTRGRARLPRTLALLNRVDLIEANESCSVLVPQ